MAQPSGCISPTMMRTGKWPGTWVVIGSALVLTACSAFSTQGDSGQSTSVRSSTSASVIVNKSGGGSGAEPVQGDGGPVQPVSADAITVTPAAAAYTLAEAGTPSDRLAPEVAAPSAALASDHRRDPRRMRLLVITADENDANYVAIRASLGRMGVPSDVLVSRSHALTESMLWDGQHTANYQAVMLASSELVYQDPATKQWNPTFSGSEVSLLWAFEAAFGVRQVSGNTFPDGPGGSFGLRMDGYVDVGATSLDVTLTDVGRKVFGYLNPAARVPIRFARVYQARPVDTSVTIPLLITADGHAVVSVTRFKDGRENLALTTSVSAEALHWLLLAPGVVSWASGGLFIGESHANLDVQIDDLFLIGVEWDVATKSAKGPLAYRMTAADLDALHAWQTDKRTVSQLGQLRLEWAFNGVGTTQPEGTALAGEIKAQEADWNFVNHTWAHRDLDQLKYDDIINALRPNIDLAAELGLPHFSADSMVQPNISGLHNPDFFKAVDAVGVRYVISDTSRPEWDNPSPNAGRYSPLSSRVLIVPRHTTSLLANVSTTAEWVSEYNFHYGPGGDQPVFDHDLTYAEILDRDSDLMLRALLTGDLDPWMFHQPNVRADGGRSVLSDLLDATFTKYLAFSSTPVRNLRLSEVGQAMSARMALDASGVTGLLTPCTSMSVTVKSPATVPVTGVAVAGKSEHYGSVDIAHVAVDPGQPATVPVAACP